ncbi:P-loop containing nucleoside triphosphate hydrolase [Sesbania bispinosa]|nr:P-loop containing nucleoside triphosphate hydrolase [Sesbania bispinosa]
MGNGNTPNEPASFWTQANALFRKNLTFQKRNVKTNVRLILFPFALCLLLVLIQKLVDIQLDKASNKCGCVCAKKQGDQCLEEVCGIQYSDFDQVGTCPLPNPLEWPPFLQLPAPQYRAVRTDFLPFSDFPNPSCRTNGSCPVTMLFTGTNNSFGQILSGNMIPSTFAINNSDIMGSLATNVLGSESMTENTNFLEPAFFSDLPIYYLQSQCTQNSTFSIPVNVSTTSRQQEVRCAQGLQLWRNSSSEVNDELYKGYRRGNTERQINEISAGYDFLNSNAKIFNVSNAYLKFLLGSGAKMLFEFVKEMPKPETAINFDLASLLGGLFFTWVILQLFPVVLTSLVYEKQQKLRIMMKMHGLGDGPYWMISYVIAYIGVFGTGLLGGFLFQFFLQDTSFPRGWIIVMELFPGFALYRGLYEFSESSFNGDALGTNGMRWGDLSDSTNGMKEILIIMFVEWLLVLFFAYYIDQVLSSGSGKSPLFFLKRFQKKRSSSFRKPSIQRQGSKVFVQMEKPDVNQEREKVEQLLLEPTINHAIVCDDLRKIYPGTDGNPEKFAVRGLSLALPQGECFGMLGPNGAGKTSFINMMIGLTKPTSGTAFVQGLDIRTDMDGIYTSMGVCPQHDLLWETLTGREHLLFYGRLKNLKGSALTQAVEESLKSVNLFHGGVADKQAGKYSGGMKRRLSVAISLIGDPKVVYMDEPSTGLDPASRNNLWNVVKRAKQDRAIILTTHSMEEAEVLCDRLGIFVDGSLQCIGNPKELKGRYGGTYVFTMTTSLDHEKDVENLVQKLSPNANKIYHISGTQKFELPKDEVKIANVFRAVETAKRNFTVSAWGLADTTLEDVFIKVARGAKAFDTLS